MSTNNQLSGQAQEACQRCGRKYLIEGISICPCIDLMSGGGYIQFSTPEDAQKAIKFIATEQVATLKRVLGLIEKEKKVVEFGGIENSIEIMSGEISVDHIIKNKSYNEALNDVEAQVQAIIKEYEV